MPENFGAAQILQAAMSPAGQLADRMLTDYFPDPGDRAWRTWQIAQASTSWKNAWMAAVKRAADLEQREKEEKERNKRLRPSRNAM